MCVLCGAFITEVHWTERRLLASRVGGDGMDEMERRRERLRRAKIVNRVLAHDGLSFHDDWSATTYVVADRKGASELVQSLGQLWAAAERLTGRPLDPLDLALIESLERDPAPDGDGGA
jgi:hypothetical protein